MSAALKEVSAGPELTREVPLNEERGAPILGDHDEVRAKVVAEFRRLADALESHELRGAAIQWREDCTGLLTVEVDSYDTANPTVRVTRNPIPAGMTIARGCSMDEALESLAPNGKD